MSSFLPHKVYLINILIYCTEAYVILVHSSFIACETVQNILKRNIVVVFLWPLKLIEIIL